jgi:hypothetical protein
MPLAVRLKKGVMGARMRCCDAVGGETRCGGVKPKAGGDRLILKGTRRHGAVGGGVVARATQQKVGRGPAKPAGGGQPARPGHGAHRQRVARPSRGGGTLTRGPTTLCGAAGQTGLNWI